MKTRWAVLSFAMLACSGTNVTIQTQTCNALQGARCQGVVASFGACPSELQMACTSQADLDALHTYATCVGNAGMCAMTPPADFAATLQSCLSSAGLSSGCASVASSQAALAVGAQ